MKALVKLGSALVLCAGMGACKSTQEALQTPVTREFHSTQSVREVAFCLANANRVAALEGPDGQSRIVLVKNPYGAVSLAFSIYPEGNGSRIEYRRIFGTIGNVWRRCVGARNEH